MQLSTYQKIRLAIEKATTEEELEQIESYLTFNEIKTQAELDKAIREKDYKKINASLSSVECCEAIARDIFHQMCLGNQPESTVGNIMNNDNISADARFLFVVAVNSKNSEICAEADFEDWIKMLRGIVSQSYKEGNQPKEFFPKLKALLERSKQWTNFHRQQKINEIIAEVERYIVHLNQVKGAVKDKKPVRLITSFAELQEAILRKDYDLVNDSLADVESCETIAMDFAQTSQLNTDLRRDMQRLMEDSSVTHANRMLFPTAVNLKITLLKPINAEVFHVELAAIITKFEQLKSKDLLLNLKIITESTLQWVPSEEAIHLEQVIIQINQALNRLSHNPINAIQTAAPGFGEVSTAVSSTNPQQKWEDLKRAMENFDNDIAKNRSLGNWDDEEAGPSGDPDLGYTAAAPASQPDCSDNAAAEDECDEELQAAIRYSLG